MKKIKWLVSEKGLPLTFIIFYIVGVCLFSITYTQGLFIKITPYTLLLAALAVFSHHKHWNVKTIAVLFSIFLLSILTEMIGVATGKLFGVYAYGIGLGFKVAQVPVLIGLNWIVLVYGSNAILSKYSTNSFIKIIGASVLMVAYDFVLEIAAPLMKMWMFDPIRPPFSNYLMWFIMAVLFHFIIEVFKINTNNNSARALFITQAVFFIFIVLSNAVL